MDITTQTDHLYGQGDTKASILNRNVNITMKHALSQVVFRMKKTEGYRQEGVLTGITLKNVGSATPLYTRATMDIIARQGDLLQKGVAIVDGGYENPVKYEYVAFSTDET